MSERTIKVKVDLQLCQSHAECVYAAPDVFELGDDDVLRWREDVEESKRAELEEAADACPMGAIELEGPAPQGDEPEQAR